VCAVIWYFQKNWRKKQFIYQKLGIWFFDNRLRTSSPGRCCSF
jgi:hypothetical protein